VAQQGPPSRRSAGLPASGWPEEPAPRRHAADDGGLDLDQDQDQDQDLPPWAGLSVSPRRPAGRDRESLRPRYPEQLPPDADDDDEAWLHTSPRTSRAIATRARKARRRILTWGAVAIAVAVIGAGAWQIFSPKPAAPQHSRFVTTYQPGDFRQVPNACRVISAATLNQYLPGKRTKVVFASLGSGSTGSQCTWTLDARPLYRVLEVTAQAYAPSLLATGNGSATFSAIDSYGTTRAALANPPKKTRLPKATMTQVRGLGNSAFSALQVITAGGDRTDLVTLVVRDHNALITVVLQGLDHSHRGGYGPVSIGQLQAGTVAAAHQVLAGLS
jgi:hypothetical protein